MCFLCSRTAFYVSFKTELGSCLLCKDSPGLPQLELIYFFSEILQQLLSATIFSAVNRAQFYDISPTV